MASKIWAGVMALLALIYVFLLAQKGIVLLATGELVAILMGLAILVLPLFALWSIYAEVRFGFAAEKLVNRAHDLGVEELDLDLRPSGRPSPASAAEALAKLVDQHEVNQDSWSHWLRLGQAYDANGERKLGRAAIRKAISLANNAKPSKP